MLIKNILVFASILLTSLTAFGDGADAIRGQAAYGNGTYENNNQPVGHTLYIDASGERGRYCVSGTNNCGRLEEIEYNEDGSDMRGKWYFGGSRGTFAWTFDDEKSFNGGFRMHRRGEGTQYIPFDGTWNGNFN